MPEAQAVAAPVPVLLEVLHTTTYRYARPVRFSTHRVLFHPRAAHDIRVLSTRLEVSPDSRQHYIHDVFSNSVAVVEPLAPADLLRFSAHFVIEHLGAMNAELAVAPQARYYPFIYDVEDARDLAPFLSPQYPGDAAQVRRWVGSLLPIQGQHLTREVLVRINEAIRADFHYAPRDEIGTQGPATTLALRTGTCRDFALLMIEAVRGLGLAARFVTGYIYDPTLDRAGPAAAADGAALVIDSRDAGGTRGSGATHAWLQVFLPGAGWVPFDPTNTLYGGTDLIRVAYTRTPEQAAPVSGHWIGAAGDFLGLRVEVQVRRLASAALAGQVMA